MKFIGEIEREHSEGEEDDNDDKDDFQILIEDNESKPISKMQPKIRPYAHDLRTE